jgi:hypothetical protein
MRTSMGVVDELVQKRSDTYLVKRDITKTIVICGSLKRRTALLFLNRHFVSGGKVKERQCERANERR